MGIQVIGDEIFYDGELVAMLIEAPIGTLLSSFVDELGDRVDKDDYRDGVKDALDELSKFAIDRARGGRVSIAMLQAEIKSIKDNA